MSAFFASNWRTLHLGEMLARNARKYPSQTAVVFQNTVLSFQDLNDRVNQLSHVLSRRKVKPGTKVAIMSYNSHHVLEAYFACNKLGAVAVPVNFRLAEDEVKYILDHSEAEVFIFGEPFSDLAAKLRVRSNIAFFIQINGSSSAFSMNYEDLIRNESTEEPDIFVPDDSDAFIMYTSGTTGRPKGAVLTHKNLWTNTTNWIMEMQVRKDSVWLSGLPLFHIGGLNGVLPFIFVGGKNILTPSTSFDPKHALELMSLHKVTHCYFVPTQWQQIVDEEVSQYKLDSLQAGLWGASPAPLSLLQKMTQTFPGLEIVSTFGQTEMSSNTCFLKGDDSIRKMGSVGLPCVNVEIRVVDDEDRDVQRGEIGEIVYRGPTVFKEYYKNAAATEEVFRNGWFHSGDLVRQDEEGYVYVVDRKKDMIISGGENIYPAEVENVIRTMPGVEDVAVVGVPHPKWVETPKAFVVTKKNVLLSEQDIIQHCQKHLAGYKKPTSVAFIQELPRNAAGKVLRRTLREM